MEDKQKKLKEYKPEYINQNIDISDPISVDSSKGKIVEETRKSFLLGGKTGNLCIRGDSAKGLWAGSANYDTAPWKVSLAGVETPSGLTNPMDTLGDVIYGGISGVPTKLGIGSAGQVLTVDTGIPKWKTPATGLTNPMTGTGDMIYSSDNSGTPQKLTIGSAGQILKVVGGIPAWGAGGGGGGAIVPVTLVVAASNSLNTSRADYVCDGTDDNLIIQQALDDLPAGGGCVVLLEGIYNISSTIVIDDNMWLKGCGVATILKAISSVAYDLPIIYNVHSILSGGGTPLGYNSNIIISDLTIDGNKAGNDTYSTPCMVFDCLLSSKIENCRLINVSDAGGTYTGNGITVGHFCNNLIITKNFISDNEKYGILCDDGISGTQGIVDIMIKDNIIQSNLTGIYITCVASTNAEGQKLIGNICKDNTESGIEVYGNSNQSTGHLLISQNHCSGNVTGINLLAAIACCCIAENYIYGNTGDGIYVNGYRNLINNNYIASNYHNGIYVNGGDANSIIGNYITDNNLDNGSYDGILVNGDNSVGNSSYTHIQCNRIYLGSVGLHVYGVNIGSRAYDSFVTNNDLIESAITSSFNDNGSGTVTTAGNRL